MDAVIKRSQMKLLLSILLSAVLFSCTNNSLTDLTPNNGINAEFAFNILEFNKAISTELTRQDTGWHVVTDVPVRVSSPFVYAIQYISTDTFAFESQDYEPVLQRIHRIANGQEITNTYVSNQYTWLNHSQFYSSPTDYLIPLFNLDGSRYWIQVFREKQTFWMTKYTARGIWAISKPKTIEGDVS